MSKIFLTTCEVPLILCARNVRTVKNGFNTLSFRVPKIWALVPTFIRISNTLQEFKPKIRERKPVGCDCNICKVYIPNLGFLYLVKKCSELIYILYTDRYYLMFYLEFFW